MAYLREDVCKFMKAVEKIKPTFCIKSIFFPKIVPIMK